MITEFTFKNFRSFKDSFTLSLEAESLRSQDSKDKLIETAHKLELLPSVGIFGPNASGKTNIIKALEFMAWAIQNLNYNKSPTTKHQFLSSFKLDDTSATKPTMMQLVIWDTQQTKEYRYGFEISRKQVLKEWLEVRSKKDKYFTSQPIFTRNKQSFVFEVDSKAEAKQLAERVRPDALAVSVFAQFNHRESLDLTNLLSRSLFVTSSSEALLRNALRLCDDQPGLLKEVKLLLLQADLAIQDIQIETRNPLQELSTHKDYLDFSREAADFNFTVRRATTKHKNHDKSDNKYVELDLENDESAGTGKFFALATQIANALDNGGVLVVDELGASLHPFITKMIIDQFDNKQTNPKGAQLIYNSHEIYLLSKAVGLRRDQIWFTDKNDQEETFLRCLSEYKTKNDYDINRNYLLGRFGAVPFLDFD